MNCENRPRTSGLPQVLAGLACLLVPGLPTESSATGARQRESRTPYLVATGPPGLRFQTPQLPPAPVLRPVAIGPPMPGKTREESTVAAANVAAVQMPRDNGPPKPAPVVAPPSKPAPPTILPDDTQPVIRAEDFLPYFKAAGALPPSSATYTQTPR